MGYGQLMRVLECPLPLHTIFGVHSGKTRLLALVEPFQTQGLDARDAIVGYKDTLTLLAMDVRDVKAVVGRVKRGNKWWIVDRFDACVPSFDEGEEDFAEGGEDGGQDESESE